MTGGQADTHLLPGATQMQVASWRPQAPCSVGGALAVSAVTLWSQVTLVEQWHRPPHPPTENLSSWMDGAYCEKEINSKMENLSLANKNVRSEN